MTAFTEYKRTSFFGRPFEELLRCFGFQLPELRGLRVLDCPAGPSSFVARANELGIDAVGADPMYYRGPDALARVARSDFKDMYGRMRAKPEFLVTKTYPSIDASEIVRGEAMEIFIRDYRKRYPSGRYVAASLPELSFADDTFDVALCGHLLFLYADQFGYAFFREAIRELLRVARKEVRIHPIVDSSGQTYEKLGELRAELAEEGYSSRVIDVDHEFFRGTNRTLVVEA